jgi:16S rRNA (adenine1518-N6/adenine1519-N6)-dimethyltransferase
VKKKRVSKKKGVVLYQPKELMRFLEGLGISPRKGLSQNFLIDGNILNKIVKSAAISPGDLVLEIGPGPGALTECLLDAGAHVVAVEKDRVLAEALNRLKEDDRPLEVFESDILEFPIESAIKERLGPGQSAKVVANLPYHLTTPILARLVTLYPLFSTLVIMVQEEVARRFTAVPGNKHYSSFTIFLNFYSKPRYGFSVKSNCFYPKPSVESAVVLLELRPPPPVSNPEAFFLMTRTAFEHRRKMLRSSLKELYPPAAIEVALEALSLNPLARPEDLSLEEHLALFFLLNR